MWMYPRFDGDDDKKLMLIQHDCYWSSTLQLFHQCVEGQTEVNLPWKIDHRTIQDAHDLFAAAFRYDFKNSSGYEKTSEDIILGLAHQSSRQKTEDEIINDWHDWLTNALDGEDKIISELQTIYMNQNVAIGYEAEDKLRVLIIQKFSHLNWCDSDLNREPWSPENVENKKVDEKIIHKKKIIAFLNNFGTKQPDDIEIFKAELDEIKRSQKNLEELGVYDYYAPPEYIDWMPHAFYKNRSGWSKVDRYDYKWRKKQLENRLPNGEGCCYVLGISANPKLCKIGFTTLSAHERALEYGKEYDLKFFVYDIIPSKNAAALENMAHRYFGAHHYDYRGSKEIFSIDPVAASRKIRQLEPTIGVEFLQREMQWLSLQAILTNVKIAKEQWRLVSQTKKEIDQEKSVLAASGQGEKNSRNYGSYGDETDSLRELIYAKQAPISSVLSILEGELKNLKAQNFAQRIRVKKIERKKASKMRWKRIYHPKLRQRNQQIVLLGSVCLSIVWALLSYIF